MFKACCSLACEPELLLYWEPCSPLLFNADDSAVLCQACSPELLLRWEQRLFAEAYVSHLESRVTCVRAYVRGVCYELGQ